MVLFLFIIMLLDIRAEELRRINWLAAAGGIGVAVILLVQDLHGDWSLSTCATKFSAAGKIDDG